MVEAICVLMLTSCLGLSEPMASDEFESDPPRLEAPRVEASSVEAPVETTETAAIQSEPQSR